MTTPEQFVHVWLINGETGTRFFEDVCGMVHHLADRLGVALQKETDASSLHGRLHYFARVQGADFLNQVDRLVGVHRAQTVPEDSSTGRIETDLVGLELLPSISAATSGRPSGPVLRTYNYWQRSVTVHASGQRLALEVALRGEA